MTPCVTNFIYLISQTPKFSIDAANIGDIVRVEITKGPGQKPIHLDSLTVKNGPYAPTESVCACDQ